jgi:hypothetical protein
MDNAAYNRYQVQEGGPVAASHAFRHRRSVWLAVLGLAALVPAASAVTFTPHYTDAPDEGFFDPQLGPQRRSAFEFALWIWQVRIPGAMSTNIDVNASFESLGGSRLSAILAEAGPSSFVAAFPEAPRKDVAYPIALANFLADSDLSGAAADIDITFNRDVDGAALGSRSWYYGLNGLPGHGDIDFISVALHELTHSMGFISTGTSDGVFGTSTPVGTLPGSFDLFLVDGHGSKLVDLPPQSANVTRRVYWSGPVGVAQYQRVFGDTSLPRIYAPDVFAEGSSLSHLDEDRFTGAYDMMTPLASLPVHIPDDIVRGIMADIGWRSTGTGDVDVDGHVGILDVFALIDGLGSGYGEAGYSVGLDVNLDGRIDLADLEGLARHFGQQGLLGTVPTLAASDWSSPPTIFPGVRDALVYQAVPEPLVVGLLLVGLIACGRRRLSAFC